MKKIKINLITQSKKEARDKARTEGSSSRPPSAGRVTRSGRSTPITSPDTELPPLPSYEKTIKEETATPMTASDPVYNEAPGGQSSTDTPKVASNPSEQHPHTPTIPEVSIQSDDPDIFIPYQPEGPPPEAVTPGESLKWLPPNVNTPGVETPMATPSPAKKNANLFHYTPGSIPFAPRPKSPVKKPDLPPPQESKDENMKFRDVPQ
jgi:histone deacetylase HOS3